VEGTRRTGPEVEPRARQGDVTMAEKELILKGSLNTEAPASLTVRFRYQGYDSMLTLRDGDGTSLLEKLETVAERLESMGASGNERNSKGNEAAWCQLHNCEMKRREKNGQVRYSHKVGDKYCKGNGKK
jgi:hypothetical protein